MFTSHRFRTQSTAVQNAAPVQRQMLQALASDRWEQREMASAYLTDCDESATMGLVMALKHPQGDVRLRAARLLGQIRAAAPGASNLHRAVPELVSALKGRDLALCAAAATALGSIGGDVAIAALKTQATHRNFYVREAVVRSLSRVATPQLAPELLAASQDKCPEVRSAAALGLGRIPDNRVITRLKQLLKDIDAEVRWHAEQGLAALQPSH